MISSSTNRTGAAAVSPALSASDMAAPIPTTGCIDLHCHLLPEVDDGCRSLEQTLICIRAWMDAGFIGSVCTPHVGPNGFERISPDLIAQRLGDVRRMLADAGIEYRLWDGGEVRLTPDTLEWFSFWGLPTLGPGRCVLVDWWGTEWPDFCSATCSYLLENGYQPILAHPERMGLGDRRFASVLDELESLGVWFQGNLNSLSGGEGLIVRERAWRLLQAGRYHVLASDTHGPETLAGRRQGLNDVARAVGSAEADRLLVKRPREILFHGAVDHPDE